jgi:hypothetical protein
MNVSVMGLLSKILGNRVHFASIVLSYYPRFT